MMTLQRNSRIFPGRANWSRQVSADYQFKTSIFTARDGTESREALRQKARVELEFQSMFTRRGVERLAGDLREGLAVPFRVRAPWLPTKVAATVAAGATTIPVASTPGWLVAGCQIIVTTETHEDWFEVSAVGGGVITILGATSAEYPAGSRVHLAYTARMPDKAPVSAETASVWTGRFRFEVLPGTPAETYPAASGDTFEGREVFLRRPNWSDTPRLDFGQERETFDPGIGSNVVAAPQLDDHLTVRYGHTGLNAASSEDLIGFFLRQRGRRNPFWTPLWTRDIAPSATDTGAASSFQIDGSEFRAAYDGHQVYRAMIAFWGDGSHQINRVSAITGAADSVVEFAAPWDQPILPTTRVHWLLRSRLESDTLDVRWRTDTVCEVALPIRSLYAPPEV